ncbi:MAG: ABC transporter permease [bacterium]
MLAVARATVVYSSEYRPRIIEQLRRVIAYREFLFVLSQRDLKLRYRQTILWVLWAVLPPVLLMGVFSVFLGRFAKIPSDGLPYPVFVYAGLLPWTFFSSVITTSTASIAVNNELVSKIAFPREILPWASILGQGVDFLISAAVFAGLLLYYGVAVSWTVLFVVPLLAIQVLFMASVGLVFAAFQVYYRDVRYVVPLLLQVWMFATPVVYSSTSVPEWLRPFYLGLNPMAILIQGYRDVVLKGTLPDVGLVGALGISMVGLFLACYTVFKRAERNFADVI